MKAFFLCKLTIDDSELTEPNQIANAFNNYFATVAPNLLQHEHQTKESYNNEPQEAESHFNFRKLSVDEVFKMLKTIDAWSKAKGADGIPAKILKAAAGPCSRLLTLLMNLSFESGVFPDRL